jgi:hypothetical protein
MSGGKASGKQPRDTAAEDALLQALHHTHREATRLFLMAVGEGATDAQIVYALRQGLPHLPDPASLHDRRAGKQPMGTGTTEKYKQPAAQKKRTRTTGQAMQTQPLLIAADALAAAPAAEPEWCKLWKPFLQNTNEQGSWPADRTIMLRSTSKRVKEVVDKMRLPAVVRFNSWSYARFRSWSYARNGTEEANLACVLRQLAAMTARCLITTLALTECEIKGLDTVRLAGVLAQCPALAHLDLGDNKLFDLQREWPWRDPDPGAAGAESLAVVLGQCSALAHLDLRGNRIHDLGRLAQVLPQCTALAHLDLSDNDFGESGAEILAGVLGQCASLAHLDLFACHIYPDGTEILAGVLGQCTALAHLDLRCNQIGEVGAEALAGVLAQCPALTHLDLRDNDIAHLDLGYNDIGAVVGGRLRASWRGQASGLLIDDYFWEEK